LQVCFIAAGESAGRTIGGGSIAGDAFVITLVADVGIGGRVLSCGARRDAYIVVEVVA
jgi:hypothetical protein